LCTSQTHIDITNRCSPVLLGKPKVKQASFMVHHTLTFTAQAVSIPHYSIIANVVQMATHYRLNDPDAPIKQLGPTDVVLGGG